MLFRSESPPDDARSDERACAAFPREVFVSGHAVGCGTLLEIEGRLMSLKLLVIGSGGREHAMAWRLSRDHGVDKVYVCPGNPGMSEDPKIECTGIGTNEFDRIASFVKANGVDFVAVGPDQALADGAVDYLESRAIPAFGPTKQADRKSTRLNSSH